MHLITCSPRSRPTLIGSRPPLMIEIRFFTPRPSFGTGLCPHQGTSSFSWATLVGIGRLCCKGISVDVALFTRGHAAGVRPLALARRATRDSPLTAQSRQPGIARAGLLEVETGGSSPCYMNPLVSRLLVLSILHLSSYFWC